MLFRSEPWCEIAKITYRIGNWSECYGACLSALAITNRELVYTVDPEVWGAMPHDYASIAAWNMGLVDQAIHHAENAVELEPDNERLLANLRLVTNGRDQH